jgi:hypothetical protein
MRQLTNILRGLGAAGAAANARDELDRTYAAKVTAEVAVRHVHQSTPWRGAPSRAA